MQLLILIELGMVNSASYTGCGSSVTISSNCWELLLMSGIPAHFEGIIQG